MKKIDRFINQKLRDANIDIEIINKHSSSYPFSYYAQMIIFLISKNIITYDEYKNVYENFLKRNPYLNVFEMAPRTFGETWLEKRIINLFPYKNKTGFEKATKAKVMGGKRTVAAFPNYSDPMGKPFTSQFDFIFHNNNRCYKIEVKACRAIAKSDDIANSNIVSRAHTFNTAKKSNYQFHFQQIKPGFCDAFILAGVCTDKILYWILTSDELIKAGGLSPQHPTSGIKNIKDPKFEGQIYKSISDFSAFSVKENELINVLKTKCK